MQHGCLPPVDRHLLAFDRWLRTKLDDIEQAEFPAWHVRRRLQTTARLAEQQPVTAKQVEGAQNHVSGAVTFLSWLDEHGLELGAVGQAEIDAWFAEGPFYTRRLATAFLKWAMSARLLTPATIPHRRELNPQPLTQQQRLDVLRRLALDDTIHPTARVSTLLMVLYAQPLLRVLRLTVDDVVRTDDEVHLRLGDPPVPVPAPFDAILADYLDHRRNLTTSNTGAAGSFPSINPGQLMTAAANTFADTDFPPSVGVPPHSNSSCSTRHPRWSRRCSASMTPISLRSPSRSASAGAATRPFARGIEAAPGALSAPGATLAQSW